MNVSGRRAERPLAEELAVLVEHLRAPVATIVHEDLPRLRIDGDAVDVVEVPRTRLLARLASLAPRRQILPVLVELDHTRAVVAVGHDEAAIGEPVHERRAVEMLL